MAEVVSSAAEFVSTVGTTVKMNDFFQRGPGIYTHHFEMVRGWVEQEWHMSRLHAHHSSKCIVSSDFLAREIHDRDPHPLVYSKSIAEFDDPKRPAQERYFSIEWEVLRDVVADWKWRAAVAALHSATSKEALRAATDEILDLLARKVTDYEFTHNEGFVSIWGRRVELLSAAAAAVGAVGGVFEASLNSLVGGSGGIFFGSKALRQALAEGAGAKSLLIPTVRVAAERLAGHQMKKAIVAQEYIPPIGAPAP